MNEIWNAFCERLFDQNKFAIKLGLDNISRALALEGLPELSHRRIIVGGTNGKGSTAAYLSNILQSTGLKVGFYSSPHLIELRERFRINGRPVSQEDVLRVGQPLMESYASEGSDPQLTFFELTTLMAAKLFEEKGVDVAVYEVGLGGRLDAVNAIEPDLTVITSIDIDHTQYLGDTVGEIAGEKAALLRHDKGAIIGPQQHLAAIQVLEDAHEKAIWADPHPEFEGIKAQHVGTALAAAQYYLGQLPPNVMEVVANTRWPGRRQMLDATLDGKPIQLFLDAAHNPAGMRALVDSLTDEVDAVITIAMKDKDLEGSLGPLAELNLPIYTYQHPSERAASPELIQAVLDAIPCDTVEDALGQASRHGRILVCGSIYLLGHVMETVGVSPDELTLD